MTPCRRKKKKTRRSTIQVDHTTAHFNLFVHFLRTLSHYTYLFETIPSSARAVFQGYASTRETTSTTFKTISIMAIRRSFLFRVLSCLSSLLLLLHVSPFVVAAVPETRKDEQEEFIVSDASTNVRRQLRYTTCMDLRGTCPQWAADGECHTNPAYMGPHCPVSCHTCPLLQPRTTTTPFSTVIPRTLKESGWEFPDAVGRDWGVPQIIYDRDYREAILARIEQVRHSAVLLENAQNCRNYNVNCTLWAVQGECEANPEYMRQYCAPVCWACERIRNEQEVIV